MSGGPGWAWRLRTFPSIASTSDLCVSLAAAGEPEGLAVLALRQTAGRGSRGRGWESPGGNLHLSALLRPRGPASEAGRWALLAAVALAEAVASALPDPSRLRLKWPNDLLLDGAKIAGILIDSAADSRGQLDWMVIGFGVNLAHAPEIAGRTTARLDLPEITPEALGEIVLERLAYWRGLRLLEGFAPVRAAWLRLAQPVGTPIRLSHNGATVAGAFAGLGEDGSLLLQSGGRVHAFATGEVLQAGT